MKPLPVKTIAHYRIVEPIGAGGMGAVYKAYDNKLQRVVALKLLPPEYVSQEDRRRRFFQEARAASALNHPHILTIYEAGEDDGRPYIAMEYVEGDTIRQKISKNGLQLRETLDIAIQLASGLARAHELGIIHRDLKPENLMLSRDGFAKILDFGLAKLVAERERALVADSEQKTLIRGVETESGTLMGTVNYMAPEQLLGQKVDRRCDVFSFGVVITEMLTGTAPFVHDNRIDTMHAILHRDPDRGRSRARTRVGHHSSRSETREPDAQSRRLRKDPRLWSGQARRRTRTRARCRQRTENTRPRCSN